MKDIILRRISDNKLVNFEIDLNNPYDIEGGEGVIYTSEFENKPYVIKPIAFHTDSKRKYKILIDKILNINTLDVQKKTLKEIVLRSFMPYAQNFHSGGLFGYQKLNQVDVFAYSFVFGIRLSEHLSGNQEMSFPDRIKICIKLIELLDFLQRDCGIVHADIYEDNFILDLGSDILYPIDSTSCGYFEWNNQLKKAEDIYAARNRGKSYSWGLPSPIDFSDSILPSQYSDRWLAARLVWRILTNQLHPFTFLTRVDDIALQNFLLCVDETKKVWPPMLIYHPLYLDEVKYEMVKSFMHDILPINSQISVLLYYYFIPGHNNPILRPSLDTLYKSLKKLFV